MGELTAAVLRVVCGDHLRNFPGSDFHLHPGAFALQKGPESRHTVRIDDRDIDKAGQVTAHTFEDIIQTADFRPQQVAVFAALAAELLLCSARPFNKVKDGGRVIFEILAGGQCVLSIGRTQTWIGLDLCFCRTLDVRKAQHFHGDAYEGHPDQCFFCEKFERGQHGMEVCLEEYDIRPALVVADNQEPLLQRQLLSIVPGNLSFSQFQQPDHASIVGTPPPDDEVHSFFEDLKFVASGPTALYKPESQWDPNQRSIPEHPQNCCDSFEYADYSHVSVGPYEWKANHTDSKGLCYKPACLNYVAN